jgi:Transposase DDE domain
MRLNAPGKLFLEQAQISSRELRRIAVDCGFHRRCNGKITAADFVSQMCAASIHGTVSYNDLAARIDSGSGVSATRQAYWARMDESCVALFQLILARVFSAKLDAKQAAASRLSHISPFQRILIQDSTVLLLPSSLSSVFSGVSNDITTTCNARIQCIYDLIAGRFLKFTIDPYSRNDLKAASDIEVSPGDLVLRDRGYFSINAAMAHANTGAHSIYRYKHNAALFHPETGERIDLLALLKQSGSLDMDVLVGTTEKFRMRLVAAPVTEETANLRRMRAKKETHGHAPSQDLLEMMSWSIFITTIADRKLDFKQILGLYGMRWRIESIFKTWKSYLNFSKVHRISQSQLRVLLTARFIMITILYQRLFAPLSLRVRSATRHVLSLMKFMRYITQNMSRIPVLLVCTRPQDPAFRALIRYCVYDKRKRLSFDEEAELILTEVLEIVTLA